MIEYSSKFKALMAKYEEYSAKDNHQEALNIALELLTYSKSAFGEDHLNTANAYSISSEAYLNYILPDQALSNALLALSIYKAKLAENHEDTATIYHLLGDIYNSTEKYNKAIEAYKRAIVIREVACRDKTLLAYSRYKLAMTIADEGDFPKAEKLLKSALTDFGNNITLYKAEALGGLASLYEISRAYKKAEKYYNMSLAMYDNIFDDDDNLYSAHVLRNLGITYSHLGDYPAADNALNKCLAIFKTNYGISSKPAAAILYHLGLLYKQQLLIKLSADYFIRALKIYCILSDSIMEAKCIKHLSDLAYNYLPDKLDSNSIGIEMNDEIDCFSLEFANNLYEHIRLDLDAITQYIHSKRMELESEYSIDLPKIRIRNDDCLRDFTIVITRGGIRIWYDVISDLKEIKQQIIIAIENSFKIYLAKLTGQSD